MLNENIEATDVSSLLEPDLEDTGKNSTETDTKQVNEVAEENVSQSTELPKQEVEAVNIPKELETQEWPTEASEGNIKETSIPTLEKLTLDKEIQRSKLEKINKLDEFAKKAIKDGYNSTAVNRLINSGIVVNTYKEFEDAILDESKSIIEESNDEQQKKQRVAIANQALAEANRYVLPRLHEALEAKIFEVYNTSAPKAVDIGEYLKNNLPSTTDIESFDNNVLFWAYCCINDPIIYDAILYIHGQWETSAEVQRYIRDYVESRQIPEAEQPKYVENLISTLPEKRKNENSPAVYKIYYAIELLKNNLDNEEQQYNMFSRIFKDKTTNSAYASAYESRLENGEPIPMSEYAGSRDAYSAMNGKGPEDAGIVGTAAGAIGGMVGNIVHMKYAASDNYDNILKKNLGKYASVYDADKSNREALKAKKKLEAEQQRQLYEEQLESGQYAYGNPHFTRKQIKQMQQDFAYQQRMQSQYNYNYNQPYNGYGYNDPRYNNRYGIFNNQNPNRDFSPKIPTNILVILVHIVIGIIMFLISKSMGVFAGIGLVVASFGWLKMGNGNSRFTVRDPNGPPGPLLMLIGYVIVIIAVVLKIA